MYIHKALLLNLLIASINRRIDGLGPSGDTLRGDSPLPKPDPSSGGVTPPPTPRRVTIAAAQVIATRPDAGLKGTADQLLTDARAFMALGQFEKAELGLRKALEEKPDDPTLAYALARVLLDPRYHKEKDAIPLLETVVRSVDAPLAAWMLLGYACLWDETKLQRAVEASDKYLSVRPDDAGALLNKACTLAQLASQGSDSERTVRRKNALDILKTLLTKHPK